MSEPVAWNRAERRRRGMTRSRMKRTGSLASAGVLVSAGLFGAYVGNPRLQRAYASPAVCSGAVTVTGPGDDTLVAALDDSTVTCIQIQGEITLSADLPVITDDSWTGGARDSSLGLTLFGVGGDDTIDGADSHRGLAILLDDTPVDTVSLSLSGLTMTNLSSSSAGGAVSIGVPYGAAALSVCGSHFADNTAYSGGAIFAASVSPGTLRINDPGCLSGPTTFARNTATGSDGGGAIFTGLDADIYETDFTGNTATYVGSSAQGGGAITAANSFDDTLSVRVFESTFTDDTSASYGGAISLAEGGNTTYLYLKDDTFSGNEAADSGGAIAAMTNDPQTVIRGSTFTDNTADWGGAIFTDGLVRIDGPDPTVFSLNSAALTDGGAIFAYDGVKAYEGVQFLGNVASGDGGAISSDGRVDISGVTFTGNSSVGAGGAVDSEGDVYVCGSNFSDNTAGSGGAIYATSNSPGALRINDPGCSSGPTVFARNTATGISGGGAIYTGLDAAIHDTEFTGNTATCDPMAPGTCAPGPSPIPLGGGAIAGGNSRDDSLSVRVFESTFTDDTSAGDGGAISLWGSGSDTTYLYLKDDTFSGNEAAFIGGAIRQRSNSPQTVIQGSTFTDNSADAGGAISADGPVRIDAPGGGPDPSIFSLNTASNGPGGAIAYAYGEIKVYDGVQFLDNSATSGGGAIYSSGRVDVSGVTFTGNSSGGPGGAIYSDDSVYADNGTQFLNNEAATGGGAISAYGRVDVSGVTFTGNSSGDEGGAIAAPFVYANDGTEFLQNSAFGGGAISSFGGRVGLDGVLIRGNAAHNYGGGVYVASDLLSVSNSTIYGNSAGLEGGGIWSDDSVTVSYSAIVGNRAVDDTNGAGVGGGIAAMGIHSEVLLTNSYVGGNQADEGAGGIYLPGAHSHLGLYFTTVYDDTVTSGGGHTEFDVHSLTAVGSAVGNQWATNVWFADVVDDTYFVSTDQSSGTWTPGSGSVELGPGVGLGLGVRDDWVTPGHAGRTPLAGSPLITGAPSSFFGVLPAGEDQLGVTRVAPFTIGARQFVAPTPPPGPSGVPPSAPRDPRAVAGNRQAVVSWSAPVDSGSFPVTDYEVASVPAGGSCLVKVPSLSCMVSGLDNGTSYVFRVRALNGAGWSPESAASKGVTPRPGPSILVTGTREGRRVKVQGATQGLTASTVVPRYHYAGQLTYKTGIARPTIDATGNFTWSRKSGRTIYLYFAADKTHSNRLVLRQDR